MGHNFEHMIPLSRFSQNLALEINYRRINDTTHDLAWSTVSDILISILGWVLPEKTSFESNLNTPGSME